MAPGTLLQKVADAKHQPETVAFDVFYKNTQLFARFVHMSGKVTADAFPNTTEIDKMVKHMNGCKSPTLEPDVSNLVTRATTIAHKGLEEYVSFLLGGLPVLSGNKVAPVAYTSKASGHLKMLHSYKLAFGIECSVDVCEAVYLSVQLHNACIRSASNDSDHKDCNFHCLVV